MWTSGAPSKEPESSTTNDRRGPVGRSAGSNPRRRWYLSSLPHRGQVRCHPMSHGGQRPKVNDRKHQWADQPVETLAEAKLRAHRLLPRRVLASGHCSTSHFSLTHTLNFCNCDCRYGSNRRKAWNNAQILKTNRQSKKFNWIANP